MQSIIFELFAKNCNLLVFFLADIIYDFLKITQKPLTIQLNVDATDDDDDELNVQLEQVKT